MYFENKENISLAFGKNIKKARLEKNLSQKKFAEISGLSATTISETEMGKIKHIDIDCAIKIANSLGVGLNKLVYGEVVSNKSKSKYGENIEDIKTLLNIMEEKQLILFKDILELMRE